MNYPYSIRSIAEIYPDFANHPHIHGIPVFRNIYASDEAGTPINPASVVRAENAVSVLSTFQCKYVYFSLSIHN